MDMKVLQECVRANVGDLTFEEAYARSKRVLNISVSSSRTQEVPQLLNYLTAPNVVSFKYFLKFLPLSHPRMKNKSLSGVLHAVQLLLLGFLAAVI